MSNIEESLNISKEILRHAILKKDDFLENKSFQLIKVLTLIDNECNNAPMKKENQDVMEEIEKVRRKTRKWLINPQQSNSIILTTFMKISKNNEYPVSVEQLKNELNMDDKVFLGHYNGLKLISKKNHAKVFEEKNKMIELWRPVSEYIIALFRESEFRKWAKESGGLTHDYVIENYVKALNTYLPENLKEYDIDPYFENIFLCSDIEILEKFHKMYLSGGILKNKEKNKNLASSLSKYIQFLVNN